MMRSPPQCLGLPRSHPRVGLNIPVRGGSTRSDGRSGRPAASLGIGPRNIDSLQVTLLIPRLGDGLDRFLFVEHSVSDPCHPKAADLDEDHADGPQ
jgi:hypothetical protein